MRIRYRLRQFWHSLFQSPDIHELEKAHQYLIPAERDLFNQLQLSEKAHAIAILDKLLARGENEPDLLAAALLHDIGKLRYHLNPIERALIVIGKTLFPGMVKRWGVMPTDGWEHLPGWRKAFILAAQHAEWGADMAYQAGASSLTVELIRDHQRPPALHVEKVEQQLQYELWLVDNDS